MNVGTLEAITEPADNSVLTSLSYTVSGLTIDADGTANDTVTFTIAVLALGTGDITWDTNGGTATDVREFDYDNICLLYTSPSPRDGLLSRMPSSA